MIYTDKDIFKERGLKQKVSPKVVLSLTTVTVSIVFERVKHVYFKNHYHKLHLDHNFWQNKKVNLRKYNCKLLVF